MHIDTALLTSVDSVEWLTKCGEDSLLSREMYLRQASSWAQADIAYDEIWEAIKDQQENAITIELCANYREQYNQWNILLAVATEEVSRRVASKITAAVEEHKMNSFYSSAICRDVQMYLLEMTYAQDGCVIPVFFRNLFAIYNAGHFPCGWGGGVFPGGYQLYF